MIGIAVVLRTEKPADTSATPWLTPNLLVVLPSGPKRITRSRIRRRRVATEYANSPNPVSAVTRLQYHSLHIANRLAQRDL